MKLIFEKSVPGHGCSILPACDVERALSVLKDGGIDAYVIGQIIEGNEKVLL